MTENREWAEPLPDGCPPPEAWEPQNEVYYRLVEGSSPTARDFDSHRILYPKKSFEGRTECQVRSVSINSDSQKLQKLTKLNIHRNKRVAKLALPPKSGVVLQTGPPSHHSWWLKAGFDPVSFCEMVQERFKE